MNDRQASICAGDRGGKVLICDGHRYHKRGENGDTAHWRCWRYPQCAAKLKTNTFDADAPNPNIRVRLYEDHIHPPDSERIKKSKFVASLKERATDNPTLPTKRLYDAEVANVHRGAQGGGDRPELPQFNSVRSIVQRVREQNVPPIPGTIEDVAIAGPWAVTWLQERHLLVNDIDWGIAIFATDANLLHLRRSQTVYMDATFRTCPRPFTQFFTILGDVHGFVVPLVQVLMSQRTIGHYRQIFQRVKQAVRRTSHHNWRPQRVICDFELALHTSIETELPHARLSGCYFHYTQSIWRRVQELRLAVPYLQDHHLTRVIKKILAIGYLPHALVQMNFNVLVTDRRTRRLVNQYPALDEFFAYVRSTYISQQLAPFPTALWNAFERDMDQRTNNRVEG